MNVFALASDIMNVRIDAESGETVELIRNGDPMKMNWIAPSSAWGKVDGIQTCEVRKNNAGVLIIAENEQQKLMMSIEKCARGEFYEETYRITNRSEIEFFLTHDNFALHYPFNCHLAPRKNLLHEVCVSHLWCGGENSWIYSEKPSGDEPGLVGIVAEGSLADYSIDYNAALAWNGSHYRGEFLLHPEDCIIAPGATLTLRFRWAFRTKRPDRELLADCGQRMFLRADRLTVTPGEAVRGTLQTAFSWDSLTIDAAEGTAVYTKNGTSANWGCSFATLGERTIRFTAAGHSAWIRINVMEPTENILHRRARFIAEKQQHHAPGSHLDGACLIYDRTTGRQFCDDVFNDSNSARERISMGCTLALAQQSAPSPLLENALKKYRAYIERELLDLRTMTVFDSPCRRGNLRAYDYPWMAFFHLEYARAMHEPEALKTATGIMLSYYAVVEKTGQDSPCIEDYRLFCALEENGFHAEAGKLKAAALHHADSILARGTAMYSEEVSYTQAQFALKTISLCQAFRMSGDRKYLKLVPDFLRSVCAFSGEQPDFHCFGQGVRYWDLYWFGKLKTYGDTMPQWLSSCTGEMFMLCGEILGKPEMTAFGRSILKNSLCVYDRGGFGSASYLVPYKVRIFYPEGVPAKKHFPAGTVYGKRYDDWADDQDWSLCFAAVRKI